MTCSHISTRVAFIPSPSAPAACYRLPVYASVQFHMAAVRCRVRAQSLPANASGRRTIVVASLPCQEGASAAESLSTPEES